MIWTEIMNGMMMTVGADMRINGMKEIGTMDMMRMVRNGVKVKLIGLMVS